MNATIRAAIASWSSTLRLICLQLTTTGQLVLIMVLDAMLRAG